MYSQGALARIKRTGTCASINRTIEAKTNLNPCACNIAELPPEALNTMTSPIAASRHNPVKSAPSKWSASNNLAVKVHVR